MSKPSQVIVVLEDDRHKMLVYRYLTRCGLKSHAIRIELSPAGEESAESWVRKKFANEVSVYRNRQAQTALIVVIDADTSTVRNRLRQLDQALLDNGKQAVNPNNEQIARLVPKRNIETWILCLNEYQVDEATDYKNRNHNWNKLIPPAAETLFQWTRPDTELPNHCIDSLQKGVKELNRLIF